MHKPNIFKTVYQEQGHRGTKLANHKRQHAACLAGLFLIGMLLLLQVLPAQTPNTATVRGQVLDQSGGAVSDTEVVLTNRSTGLKRATRTDSGGYYAIADLPLTGQYELAISKAGFAGKSLDGIQLQAGEAATFNVTLRPEADRSEVTVFGTTEGIRSDSSQLGSRLDFEKIDHTPIFGRKITALTTLNAAVRPARGTGDLFLNNPLFVINGSGRRQTSFTIDGSTGDDS